MRQLASIQVIKDIITHPNADSLEIIKVLGWTLCVMKDQFKKDNKVVFIEPDAILPEGKPEWEFMRARGFRIKTIRLRGVISQGLVFPLSILPEGNYEDGQHVDEILGITQYQPYTPAQLAGEVKGSFPDFLFKSDEMRIQAVPELLDKHQGKKFYASEKADGCFLYKTILPTWDGEGIFIGDIVNKNLSPVLIGKDKNGNFVPTQVVKRFDTGTKDKWMKIYYKATHELKSGYRNQCLTVTPNHKIFTNRGEISAFDIKIGDSLVSYATSPDWFVLHLIESSLLGDGCIGTKLGDGGWKYLEGHQEDHKEYIDYLQNWLGKCACPITQAVSGFGSNMFRVTSKQYHTLSLLRKKWYPKGKKVVPQDLSWMDDFSVAKWYMDDGSLSHNDTQNDRATFATNGFGKIEVIRLGNRLKEMYGIDFTVFYSKGWLLRINYSDGSIHKLWTALTQHVVPCMRYKLPKEYRNLSYFHPPLNRGTEILKEEHVPVVKIKSHIKVSKKNFPHGRKGFDLETTTHNYVCNGVLVHNSSMTVFLNNGVFGVCSRNLELRETEGNSFWKVARELKLESKLMGEVNKLPLNVALQGELIGPGVQCNKYKLDKLIFLVFNVFDIDRRRFLDYIDFRDVVYGLELTPVPMVSEDFLFPKSVDELVELAKGKSLLNPNVHREGVVFRPLVEEYSEDLRGRLSFKVINPDFLLKYNE